MIETVITTGTITYAIKGRDILRRNGYKAYVERITEGRGSTGCGYSVIVKSTENEPEYILRRAGIKILDVYKR